MRSYPQAHHVTLTGDGRSVTFEHNADGAWTVHTPTDTHSFIEPQAAWDAAVAAFVNR